MDGDKIKAAVAGLRHAVFESCAESRERSLALTKLDEFEMWLDRCKPRDHLTPVANPV